MYRKSIKLIRIFIVLVKTAFFLLLIYYHLELAPYQLLIKFSQEVANIYSEDAFNLYKLPYILYLPYSFINFIVVGGITISIGLYSAIKDLKTLFDYKKILDNKLIEISSLVKSTGRQVFFKNSLCQKIEWDFEDFCRNYIDKIGRYTFLFLVFAFGVSFEILIGRFTLADTALLLLFVGYLLLAGIIGAIFLGYLYYENALKKSTNLLFKLHYDNLPSFEQRYKTLKFFQRVLGNYISLYLGIILIIAAPTLSLIISIVKNS